MRWTAEQYEEFLGKQKPKKNKYNAKKTKVDGIVFDSKTEGLTMRKELADWYKSKGICPRCGRNDAFGNYIHCADCLEKIELNNIKYQGDPEKVKKYNAQNNARKKAQYQKRKNEGLCVRCGKKKSQKGILCDECWAHRQKYREREKINRGRPGQHFAERRDKGVCLYCEGEVVDGYCFCEKHLADRRKVVYENIYRMSATRRKSIAAWYKSMRRNGGQ